MYGMDQMQGDDKEGGSDVAAKLQVLDEIKALMDSRLGNKLGEMGKPKGLEVSSMKVLNDGDEDDSPLKDMSDSTMPEDKSGLSDEDMMKLKMARSKMLG